MRQVSNAREDLRRVNCYRAKIQIVAIARAIFALPKLRRTVPTRLATLAMRYVPDHEHFRVPLAS